MGKDEIRRLAGALGIEDVDRMNAGELILFIQREEGRLPCFSEAWSSPCWIGDCPSSGDCSSQTAVEV
ncbi:MAG TPA: hypothetical protein VNI58_06620 [Mariprofundaceae bacterium]|nr:hypothetical protein [Mariprofundaceae bacterium]